MNTTTPWLRSIISYIEGATEHSPDNARDILLRCDVGVSDLLPFADFEHLSTDSYGRRLLYNGGNFEVMLMSWSPGDFSAIHDHGQTQWGAVKLFGEAEHAVFTVTNNRITTKSRVTVKEGAVLPVDNSLIHQMGNRTDRNFLTLHLYGTNGPGGNVTANMKIYDLDKAKVTVTDGGAFFLLPEERITSETLGVAPDFPTALRHDIEIVRRLAKIKELPDREKLRSYSVKKQAVLSRLFSRDLWRPLSEWVGGKVATQPHKDSRILWAEINSFLRLAEHLQGSDEDVIQDGFGRNLHKLLLASAPEEDINLLLSGINQIG
jgi:predicted metal-dependent enzyme (double-stranded beta helix superfamily)